MLCRAQGAGGIFIRVLCTPCCSHVHAVPLPCAVFATASCVENGLYMGQTEFEALATPADWWLLRTLGSRFAMFAAPDDAWFKVSRAARRCT